MAGTSLQVATDLLKAKLEGYTFVKRVYVCLESEMQNEITQDDEFPVAVITIPVGRPLFRLKENVNSLNLRVFVLDLLQQDRANWLSITSDCCLILTDLNEDILDGLDDEMEVMEENTVDAVNNSQMDYCAGGVLDLAFDADKFTVCEIPKKEDYV